MLCGFFFNYLDRPLAIYGPDPKSDPQNPCRILGRGECQTVVRVLKSSCLDVYLILSRRQRVEVEFPRVAGDDGLERLLSSHHSDLRLGNRIIRPIHDPAVNVTNPWRLVHTHVAKGLQWECACDQQDRECALYPVHLSEIIARSEIVGL